MVASTCILRYTTSGEEVDLFVCSLGLGPETMTTEPLVAFHPLLLPAVAPCGRCAESPERNHRRLGRGRMRVWFDLRHILIHCRPSSHAARRGPHRLNFSGRPLCSDAPSHELAVIGAEL